MTKFFSSVACVVVLALGIAGCSSDGAGTSSGSTSSGSTSGTTGGTQYKGTFAGKGEGGAIDVTVAAGGAAVSQKSLHIMAVLTVSGTLKVTGGATITITGTYDDATKTLTIAGGGYSFTGTLGATGITGTYTSPSGSGTFAVLSGAGSKAYCGTYTGASSGVWNFTINGGNLLGSYSDTKGTGGPLVGTATPDGAVDMPAVKAKGQVTGDTATGTYEGGTWTGKGC
jgi:hypothetical protein